MDQLAPSNFTEHFFKAEISESIYKYRILKMKDSLFIYIGESDNEVFDEMAMAIQMPNKEVLGTTIMGEQLGCESQELAKTFAKKLEKQIFLSCNVQPDKMIRPLLAKRLAEEIKNNPEAF